MKKRIFFGALLSVGITLNCSAQFSPPSGTPVGSTMVSVKTSNSDLIPTQADFPFGVVNEQLVNVLTDFNVTAYFQSMSYANKQSLKELYTLWCECNGGDLVNALDSLYEFDEVYLLYDSSFTGEDLYDPLNYMWTAHSNDWLWFLKQINAEYAWDITLGDPNVSIAIIDNGVFDFDHPDLASEFVNPGAYDLYDLQPFSLLTIYTTVMQLQFQVLQVLKQLRQELNHKGNWLQLALTLKC